ncbi:MAG: hypothetical protein RL119_192, partial [Actinomycetota bacterium]
MLRFVLPSLSAITGTLTAVCAGAIAWYRQRTRNQKIVDELRQKQRQLTDTNLQLAHAATHDFLTGLLNRQGMMALLDSVINESIINPRIAVMYLDVDRFKGINDSLGHAAGDELLQIIAQRIAATIPENAHAARLGGDEFVILMTNALHLDAIIETAQSVAQALDADLEIGGKPLRVSSSIGVALGPDIGDTPRDLLGFANAALHR